VGAWDLVKQKRWENDENHDKLFKLNICGILAILSGVGLNVDQTSLPPYSPCPPTSGGDPSAAGDREVQWSTP